MAAIPAWMKSPLLTVLTACLMETAAGVSSSAPAIEGCDIFPPDNIWNTRVDNLPVERLSETWVRRIGWKTPAHPDFGAGNWRGIEPGIPYVVVDGRQPPAPVELGSPESDAGAYPIPADALIEGGPASKGDRHVLVLQRETCMLYELFNAWPAPGGRWRASSGAIFDLKSHKLRPAGSTSADAAGLPILPGLLRYDEVAAGAIRHALRFTAPRTRKAYVWPARHYASKSLDPDLPAMGQRFRLKASFDIARFSPAMQVILTAFKEYGIILADNGKPWFISGVQDPRWLNVSLAELRHVQGSDWEAVDVSPLMIDPDSGQVRQQ